MTVGRGNEQFVLRMPDGMRDQIRELACKNRRSMNSEIVMILETVVAANAQTEKADATA